MLRAITMATLIAASTTACAIDPYRHDRPARLLLGTNARSLGATGDATVAARSTTPSEPGLAHSARTISGQFTLASRHHVYAGFEVEAGVLDTPGSNFAGAYGVLGAQHVSRSGSIGVELVSGWRGLRPASGYEEVDDLIAEPRVRGQLWLGPKLTLGAVAGATLDEDGAWMAGLHLGIHSRAFGQ